MADSTWMRLLPGQRCRTPAAPNSPSSTPPPASSLLQGEHAGNDSSFEPAPKPPPRLLSSGGGGGGSGSSSSSHLQGHGIIGSDRLVREGDRVSRNPSVVQMAEELRVAIMTAPTVPTLGPEYTSYVLHLIEGYATIQMKLAKTESQVAELKLQLEEDEEGRKKLVTAWTAQEALYKAEVKRLELIIQDVSGKGVEAVVMARSGSLIRRNGLARYMTEAEAEAMGDCVAETANRGGGSERTENLPPDRDGGQHGSKGRQLGDQDSVSSHQDMGQPNMADRVTRPVVSLYPLSSSWGPSSPLSSSLEAQETGTEQETTGTQRQASTEGGNRKPHAQHRRDFSFAEGDDTLGMVLPRPPGGGGGITQPGMRHRETPNHDVDLLDGTSGRPQGFSGLQDSEQEASEVRRASGGCSSSY